MVRKILKRWPVIVPIAVLAIGFGLATMRTVQLSREFDAAVEQGKIESVEKARAMFQVARTAAELGAIEEVLDEYEDMIIFLIQNPACGIVEDE